MRVLRGVGIGVRLRALPGALMLVIAVLAVVGYRQITSGVTAAGKLADGAVMESSVLTVQYDFADLNGWQNAYAFDAVRPGAGRVEDTAGNRKVFLEVAARTRLDLRALAEQLIGDPPAWAALEVAAQQKFDQFMTVDARIAALYRQGSPAARARADALVNGVEVSTYRAGFTAVQTLAGLLAAYSAATADQTQAAGERGHDIIVFAAVLALLIAAGAAVLVTNSINQPLRDLRERLRRIVRGDQGLTDPLDTCGRDELSEVSTLFNAVVDQIAATADALSAEKSLLAGVISSIPHLVYWKDAKSRYVECNQAFLRLRGLQLEQVAGRTEQALGVDDGLGGVLAALEGQVLATGCAVVDRKVIITDLVGARRSLLLSVLPHPQSGGEPGGILGVGVDVTEITELEGRLSQTGRLESIGQLAAGIAHEINTPVQFVTHNTRFVAESLTPVINGLRDLMALAGQDQAGLDLQTRLDAALDQMDLEFVAEELPEALSQSLEGLGRVTQIVQAMRDFAHPGQERVLSDLNRAVESTVWVCRNEWKHVAELTLDLDPQLGQVLCYEGELKQVLLGVIVNAAQAIGERSTSGAAGPPGHIRVATRRAPDAIRITITDDGPGMTPTIQRRVFDPFFTTKPVGKGTGQGLSIARNIIVNRHGGTIEVHSEPGAGATFVLTLPAHPRDGPGREAADLAPGRRS